MSEDHDMWEFFVSLRKDNWGILFNKYTVFVTNIDNINGSYRHWNVRERSQTCSTIVTVLTHREHWMNAENEMSKQISAENFQCLDGFLRSQCLMDHSHLFPHI